MTGLLKDLLEDRALSAARPVFDVEAIVREGGRRRRRRTAQVGALAVAGVVCAAALPLAVTGWSGGDGEGQRVDTPVASAFAAGVPAYAIGTTLHLGDLRLELPTKPRAMVQTSSGVVYADATGEVWATTDGRALSVGQTDRRNPELVLDGDRVAWVETAADVPEFAVLDHGDSGVVSSPLANDSTMGTLRDTAHPAVVYALDDDVLYLRDPRGAVAWNFVTDAQEVLRADADGFAIDDVENGQIAYPAQGIDPDRSLYRVGSDLESGHLLEVWNGIALSPDATYLLGEEDADVTAIFEVSTGRKIEEDPVDYDFFGGFLWADEDTYLAVGLTFPWEANRVDLLRCEVGGGCQVIADDLPSFADGLVLADGHAIS